MDHKEREARLSYARNQFEIHKMYAMYWQAMAMTGAATNRNMSVGGVQCTDDEKTRDALETMKRHIHSMAECNDTIDSLIRGNESERP